MRIVDLLGLSLSALYQQKLRTFLTMLGVMFGSFVMVPLTLRPLYRNILSINPIFGLTDAFRAAIFGVDFRPMSLLISTVTGLAVLLFGLFYFRRTERRFADIA